MANLISRTASPLPSRARLRHCSKLARSQSPRPTPRGLLLAIARFWRATARMKQCVALPKNTAADRNPPRKKKAVWQPPLKLPPALWLISGTPAPKCMAPIVWRHSQKKVKFKPRFFEGGLSKLSSKLDRESFSLSANSLWRGGLLFCERVTDARPVELGADSPPRPRQSFARPRKKAESHHSHFFYAKTE